MRKSETNSPTGVGRSLPLVAPVFSLTMEREIVPFLSRVSSMASRSSPSDSPLMTYWRAWMADMMEA